MKHVTLHTPVDPEVSAGINCFMIDGYNELEAVKAIPREGRCCKFVSLQSELCAPDTLYH